MTARKAPKKTKVAAVTEAKAKAQEQPLADVAPIAPRRARRPGKLSVEPPEQNWELSHFVVQPVLVMREHGETVEKLPLDATEVLNVRKLREFADEFASALLRFNMGMGQRILDAPPDVLDVTT